MFDLYLKADSEAEMMTALSAAGLVIGTMFTTDGIEVPGFHANVRTDDPFILSTLEPLSCPVSSPSFVFA